MNTIKSLLAVSVLAAAGAANASTVATFTATQNVDSVSYIPLGGLELTSASLPHSGTGTATLDSSGSVSIETILHLTTVLGTDSFTDVRYDLPSVPGSTGTATLLGCTNGPGDGSNQTCSSAPALQTGGIITGSISAAGGTIGLEFNDGTTSDTKYSFTLTPTPAVPVPAAAWLFGSGLLGLAGTARRRRAA